jgi:hypothetical protein
MITNHDKVNENAVELDSLHSLTQDHFDGGEAIVSLEDAGHTNAVRVTL